ncbi:hypothetical protein IAQ61_011231 [Plenodomus lingam]|uniref:uncharacterized protein n=1 Tax=Leptosphaeria maculans TaxID=5022 RepID=UPI003333B0C0|nr:hypothetical protein IAQ61_011231 [Plenodomus lingam]
MLTHEPTQQQRKSSPAPWSKSFTILLVGLALPCEILSQVHVPIKYVTITTSLCGEGSCANNYPKSHCIKTQFIFKTVPARQSLSFMDGICMIIVVSDLMLLVNSLSLDIILIECTYKPGLHVTRWVADCTPFATTNRNSPHT